MGYDQWMINADANTSLDLGLPDKVFFTIGDEYRRESCKVEQRNEASFIYMVILLFFDRLFR